MTLELSNISEDNVLVCSDKLDLSLVETNVNEHITIEVIADVSLFIYLFFTTVTHARYDDSCKPFHGHAILPCLLLGFLPREKLGISK